MSNEFQPTPHTPLTPWAMKVGDGTLLLFLDITVEHMLIRKQAQINKDQQN